MFAEIKKISVFFTEDKSGRQKRERIIIAIIIALVLLSLNRLLFYKLVPDDLHIYFQQAKLLFTKNLSPYDDGIQNFLIGMAKEEGWLVNNSVFDIEVAIWQLIYYLPFSMVRRYPWGASLFLTVTQLSTLLSIHFLFKLIGVGLTSREDVIFFIVSSFSLYLITNILQTNLAPIHLFMLIGTLYFQYKKKPITSGILLGLALFDSTSLLIPLVVIIVSLLKNKQFITIFWGGITITISTLFIIIFDRNWLFGWLKNLFLTPQRVPFLTFPEALNLKYNIPPIQIFIIISFILMIWTAFETWRITPKSNRSWLWLLGLSSIINHYLVIQKSEYSAILFIIPFILIISAWKNKLERPGRLVLFIITIGITIAVSIIYYVIPGLNRELFLNIFIFILSIFLVINLYWLRRWVINPFEIDKI